MRTSRWRTIVWGIAILGLVVGAYAYRGQLPNPAQQAFASVIGGTLVPKLGATATPANPSPVAAAPKAGGPPPAPVHVALVGTSDFPVTLSGLGTVQAFNSVLVRSRVDGAVEEIAREEGQAVKAGDLLVKLDSAPFVAALNQATAKLAQDQATLKNASQDLERTQVLVKSNFATPQVLDQRLAAVATATAQLRVDNAAIEAAKVQLGYTEIKSPIDGVAGFRSVDAGNIVHANDANGVMSINQVQPITVVFTAPESSLPSITAAKASGPVEVIAYSSDGKTLLDVGELRLFDNQIDQATGTIRLKATFQNKSGKLWPGLSVTTKLRVETLKNVVVVPDRVVQRGPNGLFAYVVGAGDVAELRSLRVGQISDDRDVILSGLAAGERVVVSGHYRVQNGAKLTILTDTPSTADAQSALKE